MELNGLQIFKYLPGAKKLPEANCKKCGFPTCMTFALKVAQKQTTIDKCEYAPVELIEKLQEALKVKQSQINFGNNLAIGGETVMFRHEKTFVNRTIIAITLDSADTEFDRKLDRIADYSIERIGETFKIDAINLIDNGNVVSQAEKIVGKGISLILTSDNEESIVQLEKYNPIINTSVALQNKTVNICASASSIDELSSKSSLWMKSGHKNLVLNLDIDNKPLNKTLEELTYIRRLAIIKKEEAFTYPVLTRIKEKNVYKATAIASSLLCRYSNIIVFDEFNEAVLATIFTLRQNIYTDPQKPLQVESKIYEVNDPNENSIVLLTTNFALTYFAVLNEMESASYSCYIAITPSDGMSVLTAWSAEKFTADIAAKVIKDSDILKAHKNKKIIIPGLLSHMKEELSESIDGWEIIVGPAEAYLLPDFVKNNI